MRIELLTNIRCDMVLWKYFFLLSDFFIISVLIVCLIFAFTFFLGQKIERKIYEKRRKTKMILVSLPLLHGITFKAQSEAFKIYFSQPYSRIQAN